MKIIRLQFLSNSFHVGTQGKATADTHDIERLPGEGFILKHRQSGNMYFVPYAHAIAQIEPEAEDDSAGNEPRRAAGRRRGKPDDPTPIQS